MIPAPGYYTLRETALKLRMHKESVCQHIYPKQSVRKKLEHWPSVKIDGRRLIPKEFVDKLTPMMVHRKKREYRYSRPRSTWRGLKIELAEQKLKELGLDKAIAALDIPKIDLD